MVKIELDYVHVLKIEQRTIFNFPIIEGIKEYNGASIRNRVILKFDIVAGLTGIFKEDTLKNYRDIVFGVISGLISDSETRADAFKALYKEDNVFHNYMASVFYFDEESESNSFMEVLSKRLVEEYHSVSSNLIGVLDSQRCKCFLESEGFLYVAIPDKHFTLKIPGNYSEEVLSRAKVWDYDFERV